MIKAIIKKSLKTREIFSIPWGKNRGLKLRYFPGLNLDMALGLHEPNTFEVMNQLIKPGMVVADIGANIGYFAKFLNNKVGATGRVYAFEPIPDTFLRLQETLELNRLSNVTAIQKAVTDTKGEIQIYFSKSHYMASVDKKWASDEGGSIVVPTTSLDYFFEELGKYPDFIKMDIEGGGVLALEGMKKCITSNYPILLLESHTHQEDLAIGKALQIINYRVFRVGNPLSVVDLNAGYENPLGVYGTVVAIPENGLEDYPGLNPKKFQKRRLGQR